MSHPSMQAGDTGTALIVTLEDSDGAIDVSDATTIEFVFEYPDRSTTVLLVGEFYSDGTDGKVQYVTEADDFIIPGKWKLQVHIVTPLGEWHSSPSTFWIIDNIPEPAV